MSQWIYEGTANINLVDGVLEISHPNSDNLLASLPADSLPEVVAAMNGESFAQLKINLYSNGTVEIAEEG